MMEKEPLIIFGCFSVLLLLSGCGEAEPDCGSVEAHDSVVRIAADDSDNPLINYAIKNSKAVAEEVSNSVSAKAMSTYRAQSEAIDAEWKTISDQIREIRQNYVAQLNSWEEDKKKSGSEPGLLERNVMWSRLEKQVMDDSSPYEKRLAAIQEERGRRNIEYQKLASIEEDEKVAIWSRAKQDAVYALDTIRMSSRDSVTRAVTCKGRLSVFVASSGAVQDIGFKVERTTDRTMFVSVNWLAF